MKRSVINDWRDQQLIVFYQGMRRYDVVEKDIRKIIRFIGDEKSGVLKA